MKLDKNAQLVVVSDLDAGLEKTAKEHAIPLHFGDYRQMLLEADVDSSPASSRRRSRSLRCPTLNSNGT